MTQAQLRRQFFRTFDSNEAIGHGFPGNRTQLLWHRKSAVPIDSDIEGGRCGPTVLRPAVPHGRGSMNAQLVSSPADPYLDSLPLSPWSIAIDRSSASSNTPTWVGRYVRRRRSYFRLHKQVVPSDMTTTPARSHQVR